MAGEGADQEEADPGSHTTGLCVCDWRLLRARRGPKDCGAGAVRGPGRCQRVDTEGHEQPFHLLLKWMEESGAVGQELVCINRLLGKA